jgi:hypothetical protein
MFFVLRSFLILRRISMKQMLAVALVLFAFGTSAFAAEKPLTNDDVVKLVKLGLGDDVVAAKIRQAPEVQFSLETDDLSKLKSQGVSAKVITAMLEKTSSVGSGARPIVSQPVGSPLSGTATLESSEGKRTLTAHFGQMHQSGFGGFGSTFSIFEGARAGVRTHDRKPTVIVRSDTDPQNQLFLVKLDPDTKDNDRSLKIGSFWKSRGGFSTKGEAKPDVDWTIAFDATESSSGVWRISPKKELEPGEYGIYQYRLFSLMDFGVD